MKPIVTVIMPVYNAEKYLEESIESILNQSFKDFELLVINDGSTDLSSSILNKYKMKDQRIRIINNEGNKGLPYTRDKGLKLAKGKYIALMDADDVSYKNRLEEQVNYLDFNKEIDIVASNFDFIENGEIRRFKSFDKFGKKQYENYIINLKLMFYNPIGNSTVMFRKSTIDELNIKYRKDYFVAQDYAFWVDCICGCKFHIIKDSLLAYRQGHENITKRSIKSKSLERKMLINTIREDAIKNNKFNLSDRNLAIFKKIFSDPYTELKYEDFIDFRYVINGMIDDIENIDKKKILADIAKYQITRRLLLTDMSKFNKFKVLNQKFNYESLNSKLITMGKVLYK